MVDNFTDEAPHMRPDPEPDGAMEMCAYAVVLTVVVALILVGVLCL